MATRPKPGEHQQFVIKQHRKRRRKDPPPDTWAIPPDVEIDQPANTMGYHPRFENGEWVWPKPTKEALVRLRRQGGKLQNAWADFDPDAE